MHENHNHFILRTLATALYNRDSLMMKELLDGVDDWSGTDNLEKQSYKEIFNAAIDIIANECPDEDE